MKLSLTDLLAKHKPSLHHIVNANNKTIIPINLSEENTELTQNTFTDTASFSTYINNKLATANAAFAIGGYNENRMLYKRSQLFAGEQPRTLHLGVDVWGQAGTPVYAPMGGMVHSFAFNNNFGDYGATIILQHNLETTAFYTLYGHLAEANLGKMRKGRFITRGEVIGHFGEPFENGNWPPHLHFQIIEDIGLSEGDYPGVCTLKESKKYLANCPNANLMLNF